MLPRPHQLLLAIALTTVTLVGCIGGQEDLSPASTGVDVLQVVDAEDQPIANASVTALGADDQALAIYSTGPSGTLGGIQLPASTHRLLVAAPGYEESTVDLATLPATIRLEDAAGTGEVSPDDPTPVLRFLEPLDLGAAYLGGQEDSCEVSNCGASEPVVEVAGDGTIYVSGVCCIGESPPIWYSTDGGASFQELEGDALRDNFGIEGDLAFDDAGNLYFTDISVASAYIASWGPDREHRHTVPAGPFKPLVDRPWVRAGAEDHVWFLYNTGTSTMLYESTDGGLTWLPLNEFPENLGAFDNGPENEHLWVTARGQLWESTDGGQTWEDPETIPAPSDDGGTFQAYWVPVVDEAGHLYVVYDWVNDTADSTEGPWDIYMAHRAPNGTWDGPHRVSPPNGTHHLPWAATGREGSLVVAWYGTPDDQAGPNDVDDEAWWEVYTAASVDAASGDPSFQRVTADPEPVHQGPMDRKLLDFLQVDIGPDGAIHLAYAQDRQGQPDERTQYVRSTTGLQLQPASYPHGP